MRRVPWDRDRILGEVRDRIWLHVGADSAAGDLTLDAAALLGLDETDLARIADLHWLVHPSVGTLLDAAPGLLRRLASDTTRTTETSADRVRGPVDWPATVLVRARDRPLPVVVSRPVRRDLDVPANRLLALLLGEIAGRGHRLKLRPGRELTTGAVVHGRASQASRFAAHRALRDVTPGAPTARQVQSLASPRLVRRHGPLLDCWHAYDRLALATDPAAIRRAIERTGLATTSDATLFEVYVLFRVRDALAASGWTVSPLGLFAGALEFTATRAGAVLTGWYQHTPAGLGRGSRYVAALRAHGLSNPQDLRPDMVLRLQPDEGPGRWVVIEAKTTHHDAGPARLARRALADLLAYRRAYGTALARQDAWGLGVVWGEGLAPADHEVRLTTVDLLADGLAPLLR